MPLYYILKLNFKNHTELITKVTVRADHYGQPYFNE